MKANEYELRLGNLLYFEGEALPFEFEFVKWDNWEQFTYIPLTEEWLLNLGFYNKGYESVNQYEVNTSVMCIGEDDMIKVKFIKEWYGSTEDNPDYYIQFYLDDNSIRTIKYVHQLQNLYFAITGEELKYNA